MLKNQPEFYESMPKYQTNTDLVNKLFIMRNHLYEMFPNPSTTENIGQKFEQINLNIFTNEYYYGIMNTAELQLDQQMYK